MEVDHADAGSEGAGGTSSSKVHLWCSLGSEGVKRFKVDMDLTSLTLEGLKDIICQQIGSLSPEDLGG
jgi:hypothetical protein